MADENSKGFDAANFLDNYREDIATPVRKTKKQGVQQPVIETPRRRWRHHLLRSVRILSAKHVQPLTAKPLTAFYHKRTAIFRNFLWSGYLSGSQSPAGRSPCRKLTMTKS